MLFFCCKVKKKKLVIGVDILIGVRMLRYLIRVIVSKFSNIDWLEEESKMIK